MSGFGTVSSTDVRGVISTLSTVDKGLAREWRDEAYDKVSVPWARALSRKAPFGSKGDAAGRSIVAARTLVPGIYGGKGSYDGWQPFFALEYGMSHTKFHTYIRRDRKNPGRHIVRRRTGTWAPVHRGSNGYWFWPYWEANVDGQFRELVAGVADDYLRRVL